MSRTGDRRRRPRRTRRWVLLALAGLPLAAGGASADERAGESPDVQAVREAHTKLMQAYASVDIDGLAGLLDPSQRLLIYHPRGDLSFESLPSVRWGIERMMARVGPTTWLSESHNDITVVGDVAWHTYQMAMEWNGGGAEPIRARGTEIWVRHAAGWRLAHAHWSERRVAPDGDEGETDEEDVELPEG